METRKQGDFFWGGEFRVCLADVQVQNIVFNNMGGKEALGNNVRLLLRESLSHRLKLLD